ncbi:MAG: DUF3313 family protein [Woeseiaceae bacterium]
MQYLFDKSKIIAAILGLSAIVLAGCAAPSATIDTSAGVEPTFDGLYPVKGGRMDGAWARPDFSVEPYSKIMLQGVGIEYRPGGSTRPYSASRSDEYYEMSPEQKERFEAEMRDAFLAELNKGEHYEIVTEPGADVLLVRGGLLDVVSYVPPDPVGNSDIYLSRVGEATLVLEIRDSVSGAILLRAIDRRAAEDIARGFTNSNRVSNRSEARRLAQTWGRILREGLDRFMATGDEAGE